MNKVWIILFVVLFILIVFALHLEGIGFVVLTIGQVLDVFIEEQDKMKKLNETFKKRQESIDALNNKIDELLKNQEEYLNFKGKFNDLYKNEVLNDSKS